LQNFSQRHLCQRHAATIFSLRKTLFATTLRFLRRHLSLQKTIFFVVCHRPIERFPYYLKARKKQIKVTKSSLIFYFFSIFFFVVNNNIFIMMVWKRETNWKHVNDKKTNDTIKINIYIKLVYFVTIHIYFNFHFLGYFLNHYFLLSCCFLRFNFIVLHF
jgi:hypothetical protein